MAWRASWRKRAEVASIAAAGLSLSWRALGRTLRCAPRGSSTSTPRRLRPAARFTRSGTAASCPASGLLQAPRHRRHHQREFRRRVDRAHHQRFGYGTARGSTSRGAGRALLQLVRDVKDKPVAFTLDGPRGPARVAQPGAVWLAKATGKPVIPFHLEAAGTGRCGAGTERRFRGPSAEWRSSSATDPRPA